MRRIIAHATTGIGEFLRLEAAGGIVLLGAAVLALIVSNSPVAPFYKIFLTYAGGNPHRRAADRQADAALDQ